MHSNDQKHAIWIWQGLPHMLIWVSVLLLISCIGFSTHFAGIQPALPLMVALLWSWEWRSSGIGVSLLLSGMLIDLLSGLPIGWHGVSWSLIYLLMPVFIHQFSEDEPFVGRLMTCGICLAIFLLVELLFAAIYGLAASTIGSLVVRWLLMILCLPLMSWIIWQCKQRLYRKLWMLLPDEMRISAR